MSRDREYLLDIVQAGRLAIGYVADKTEADFLADTQCQDAVIRRLEVIGEAARRISQDTRETLPQIPWSAIIGMRNIMIHQYDDVDMTIVWNSVQDALPSIVAEVERSIPPGPAGG